MITDKTDSKNLKIEDGQISFENIDFKYDKKREPNIKLLKLKNSWKKNDCFSWT